MARMKTYNETRYEPEEWRYTDPFICADCEDEFDLDDDGAGECGDGELRCAECRKKWRSENE